MEIDVGEVFYAPLQAQTTRRDREDTMISNTRSAEQWLEEVNQIVRSYRSADPKGSPHAAREAAIKQLRDLGLTEGDALRYLGEAGVPEEKRPRG